MNITEEMIEAVGQKVGMSHGGWGEVNPRELMDAIWRVLCAAKASEGGKKSRRVLTSIAGAARGSEAGRKCKCDICTKWSPLQKRITAKLRDKDRKLFDEFLMMNANDSDDLCVATAKLAGDWPGWEWMKVAVKLMMAMPPNSALCDGGQPKKGES